MCLANPEDFRIIGKVVAAHGLQGTLKVESWSDFPERFTALKQVYLRNTKGELSLHEVAGVRFSPQYVLLKLVGVSRREQAENYREAELLVPDEESWPLSTDRYYISDLVGIEAVGTDETILGQVVDVATGGAQDLLIIEGPHGELLIPMVDEWVLKVDLAARKILVANWRDLIYPEECKDAN